jgi:thiamine-monophosphate kinase
VIALGRTDAPLMRSGARPGEELWVSGPLGGAAAALTLLRDGATPPPLLRSALASPPSRVAAARALAEAGCATALIDLSDGLAGDAGQLAAASGVGVELDEEAIPVHAEARRALGDSAALSGALQGGEDYELLWTTPPALAVRLVSAASGAGFEPTRVGRVDEGAGVRLRGRDGVVRPLRGAFDHFSGSEAE